MLHARIGATDAKLWHVKICIKLLGLGEILPREKVNAVRGSRMEVDLARTSPEFAGEGRGGRIWGFLHRISPDPGWSSPVGRRAAMNGGGGGRRVPGGGGGAALAMAARWKSRRCAGIERSAARCEAEPRAAARLQARPGPGWAPQATAVVEGERGRRW